MNVSSFSFILLAITGVLLSVAGCGGGGITEPVTGKVTFKDDGSPVAGGTIVFADMTENSSSLGYIEQDGTYTLGTFDESDGAPVGKYKVTIIGDSEYGQKSAVAQQFGNQDRTPLEAEVTQGPNTIDFQVERAR